MRVAWFAGVFGLVACSALVDTAGLTGNASDAGAAALGDASRDDAVASGPALDATGTDAAPNPGGIVSPCPGTFVFCDDFDSDASSFVPPWSDTFINNGSAVFSTERARSGSRSARLATVATNVYDNAACLFQFVNVDVQRARFAFDVFATRIDSNGDLYLGNFQIGESLGLRIRAGATVDLVREGATIATGGPFRLGEWFHVELDLRSASATLSVNGAVVAGDTALTPPMTAGPVRASIGIYFGASFATGHEVFIDNVTIDLP